MALASHREQKRGAKTECSNIHRSRVPVIHLQNSSPQDRTWLIINNNERTALLRCADGLAAHMNEEVWPFGT